MIHSLLVEQFYSQLKHDKVKINWNNNPIKMSQFLSFLTVDVIRSYEHLGSVTGWTRLENKEFKLAIGGGLVNGCEYLDSIQYGVKLSNPYNNFVNPFFLFDILTEDGKAFFVEYYEDDINKLLSDCEHSIESLRIKLNSKIEFQEELKNEVNKLRSLNKIK